MLQIYEYLGLHSLFHMSQMSEYLGLPTVFHVLQISEYLGLHSLFHVLQMSEYLAPHRFWVLGFMRILCILMPSALNDLGILCLVCVFVTKVGHNFRTINP